MEHKQKNTFADEIKKATNISIARCYQCGKCSAGCPMAVEMDYPPSLILRMLQSNIKDEEVLKSKTIWLCLNCETCVSRCPQDVDLPTLMDFLRSVSLKLGKSNPKSKKIIAFHKSFLESIKNTGKLHEISLIASYKLKVFDLFQDVNNVPAMLKKGKLHVLPEKVKNMKSIKKIFSKTVDGKEKI